MRRPLRLLALAPAIVLVACGGGVASAPADPTPEASAPAASAPAPPASMGPVELAWATTAEALDPNSTERHTFDCPAGGTPFVIWGTDIYTDDSSVCTAGVHVGVITFEEGGTVTIELRPGQDEYVASERNGVTSTSYPDWPGSFEVVDD